MYDTLSLVYVYHRGIQHILNVLIIIICTGLQGGLLPDVCSKMWWLWYAHHGELHLSIEPTVAPAVLLLLGKFSLSSHIKQAS